MLQINEVIRTGSIYIILLPSTCHFDPQEDPAVGLGDRREDVSLSFKQVIVPMILRPDPMCFSQGRRLESRYGNCVCAAVQTMALDILVLRVPKRVPGACVTPSRFW
jgi:hypothetical protein